MNIRSILLLISIILNVLACQEPLSHQPEDEASLIYYKLNTDFNYSQTDLKTENPFEIISAARLGNKILVEIKPISECKEKEFSLIWDGIITHEDINIIKIYLINEPRKTFDCLFVTLQEVELELDKLLPTNILEKPLKILLVNLCNGEEIVLN